MNRSLAELYRGDFNTMSQEWHEDGSVTITLGKDNEPEVHRMRARDLYGPNEEVLEEEVIEAGPPQHIRDRMEEARRQGSKP